jgi:haloalkane dehalogenase
MTTSTPARFVRGTDDEPARPAWVPTALYPFADQWASIDGNLVHYVDEGTGPPLLLLNGNPSWSFGWRDVILRLRARFRCIAPDYPGFGLSRAAQGFDYRPISQSTVIEQLMDLLGVRGVTLVAYDWGGPIGLGIAGRRPELFRAIVLGNTWGWPLGSPSLRLFSALAGGPLGPLAIERLNVMLRVFLRRSLRRSRLTPAEVAAYEGPFREGHRYPMLVFPREIIAGRPFLRDVEGRLGRLSDRPVLLLWADGSAGLGEGVLRRWIAQFPSARVVRLTGVGRYIDEDAPDDVADAIVAWWDDVVDSSGLEP